MSPELDTIIFYEPKEPEPGYVWYNEDKSLTLVFQHFMFLLVDREGVVIHEARTIGELEQLFGINIGIESK